MIIFLRKFWKKRVTFLVLVCTCLIVLCSGSTTVLAQEQLMMYAQSYALTDGETGRLLIGKNESNPMANASTTKILTCIITLETCDLNEMVTISANASAQPKVRLGMGEGEQYPLVDLLYGLMLESYNDCAVAIAEHVAGSVSAFSQVMNKKAAEIGCENSFFLTPNGLDAENENDFHHSTAEDLCRIMAYCVWKSPMKETFLQVTQTREYIGMANGNSYTFVNRNAFLDQMEGVVSGKTGYTSKAGYCYVAALEQDGEKYCIALLACGWPNNKTWKWSDARTLLEYGLSHFEKKRICIKETNEQLVADGYIDPPQFEMLNQKDCIRISAEERVYEILLGDQEEVKKEYVLEENIRLPITKGEVLGRCNIYIDEKLYDSFPLVSESDAAAWNIREIAVVILSQFLTFSS